MAEDRRTGPGDVGAGYEEHEEIRTGETPGKEGSYVERRTEGTYGDPRAERTYGDPRTERTYSETHHPHRRSTDTRYREKEREHEPSGSNPVGRIAHLQSAISWKGIFAGAFVGILAYLGLAALGMAFGAIGMGEAVEAGSGGVALTVGMGIWMVFITLVALFVGGYVAARASGVMPTRIGGIEGLVVAGLFFVLMVTGFGLGIGALGRTATSVVGSVAGGVANVAQSPQVQSVVEEATAGLNLRSEPGVVIEGVATRLMAGREEAAGTYLAQQAGISRAEAQQRLERIRGDVVAAGKSAAQAAATGIQIAGWVMFGMILLGSGAGLFGGVFGARRNIKRPLSERDRKMALESRREWTAVRTHDEPLPGPT